MSEQKARGLPASDGNATCDRSRRVHVASAWAEFFREGASDPAAVPLVLACLNGEDIQVFRRADFMRLRAYLLARKEFDQIDGYRILSGETVLDAQARLVIPIEVWRVLKEPPGKAFRITATVPPCLVPLPIYEARRRHVQPSADRHQRTVEAAAECLSSMLEVSDG